ncbi:uncharacterized protein GGS22DRAFT_108816 [Annulohypoxylon maeteangense]|uniref:uncharacterized protein n=1 Tax=Annulohypoxylon maeteangense TaxID=1927788 RepID=UPI0020086469|nr:uncharacterized protein GGS22DRAFT_108816 [Annulohypoxylon maeteangense]KAI0887392.1 hypothetical protein GGS22DRAFT_108816 [Annulohypoxylon maeteangense]
MQATDLLAYAADINPATYCQLFYVLAAATVLAIAATPESIQSLLTRYGARSSAENGRDKRAGNGLLVKATSWATSVGKVPHSWFIHFYILSVTCSAFWAVQFLQHGSIMDFIVRNQASSERSSMTINQVILAWLLMSLQGVRRLYEYLAVLRPSPSKMWVVHWLLGAAFYFCTNISVWVEGSNSIRSSERSFHNETLSFKEVVGVSMFLTSWFMQYRCHSYLSRLKKYSLPDDGLFRYLVCPHYTCECILYISLAIVAAPEGQLYNRTLICAVLFVTVNLGVTAKGTKNWYGEMFGLEKVQGKWRMIPGVY